MRKSTVVISLVSLASLTACGSTGLFDRDRPDEFAVSRQPPLVIPPDFSLVPPQPGQPRPQTGGLQQQTLEALFGGPQARSVTESAVVAQAGDADGGIRSSVGDPDTYTVDKGSVTRDIIAAPEGDGQNAQAAVPE
ncbi:MAG: DUF3035 domain-containing protein [Sphingomonadales bacterium]|nr:DUF3035 domain-containing protein [Sphingomonadales bacterium]NCO50213.1 DUF3035 domain-containing protein [Sphingomonadales bacterium]NCP01700.1 DUF3035 domain-containing protein [Sphingomonadales bacterium]NCP28377.1 DUF3035 domain-containing protein [Sphingomonadales bacterium]NCP50658.1 DUF3035 domain-containing protein [Sphingomonadales bacterium]